MSSDPALQQRIATQKSWLVETVSGWRPTTGQRLRHNIPEVLQWPVVDCHHLHDASEWDPVLLDGVRFYPSKEEAEYTACLAFATATSVSLWAVKMGFGVMAIPRLPPV
jgi:hypothetical protein